MRVTNTMMTRQALHDMEGLRSKYSKAQAAVNGRALERPSDDPQRVVEAMDLSGAKLRLQRSMRSGEDAREWLSMTETGMNAMVDQLQAARELAVQAGSPSLDGTARESMARQVIAIRDSLLRELNMQHRDQYLFAGWRTTVHDGRPFGLSAEGGVSRQNDEGQAFTRDIAPGLPVTVNVTGHELFGGGDFVRTLTDLASDLRSGNIGSATSDRLGEIDRSFSHLTVLRSDLGVRMVEIDKYHQYAQDALFHIEERLTGITGTDLETAVLRMTEAQTAYQAALASFAKALPTSLIDYMLR